MLCTLQVAQEHGILLDPIYTLAAWETSKKYAQQYSTELSERTGAAQLGLPSESQDEKSGIADAAVVPAAPHPRVAVMLHSGGAMLGLHGLAQRFPAQF